MAAADTLPRNDPSTESTDYKAMADDWQTIGDILDGVSAVKANGVRYLPQFQKESAASYSLRKDSAPWRPEFADALASLSSKPFTKPVSLNPDAPDVFLGRVVNEKTKAREGGLIDDIDGQGNSLHVFARETFYKGIGFGLEAIYVTFPDVEPARTVADEKRIGARPYWVHVAGRDIIDCRFKVIAGQTVVKSIRIKECATESDGFAETLVERIRWVYLDDANRPVWQLFRKGDDGKYSGEAAGSFTGVTQIPIAMFFTGLRSGNYRVKPPLADLAQMQIELYQRLSRHDQIETLAGSPMLVGKGFNPPVPEPMVGPNGQSLGDRPAPQIEVGPGVVLFAPPAAEGVQPGWEYIQPQAANMQELRASVDKCMEDFRRLALQPTTPQSGNMVATGQAIDAAKSHSAVEAWANGLADCLNQALVFTCQWLKLSETVTAIVYTDFGAGNSGTEEAKVVGNAQQRGVLSKKTEREELARRGILGPTFDEDAEEQRLAEEEQGLQPEQAIDPATGELVDPPLRPKVLTAAPPASAPHGLTN